MKLSDLTCVVLALHLFVNSSCTINNGAVSSTGMAKSIKRFLEIMADVNGPRFNEKYVETITDVIHHIDMEIESKTKEHINAQIQMQDFKQDMMRSSSRLHMLEAQFRDRQAPPEMHTFQKSVLKQSQHYSRYQEKLGLVESLIHVTKQVRDLINTDLQAHVKAMEAADPNPMQNSERRQVSEKMMADLVPLIQRALELTEEANKFVKDEKEIELNRQALNAQTDPYPEDTKRNQIVDKQTEEESVEWIREADEL